HVCGLPRCDGYNPRSHLRALRTLMPAAAAAVSCVLPSIRFLRNTPTCASLTMEPHHLAPLLSRAFGTATTGNSNCRHPADLIVVDQATEIPGWKAASK